MTDNHLFHPSQFSNLIAQFRTFLDSINHSSAHQYDQPHKLKILHLHTNQLPSQLKILQWRIKTHFPIIKIHNLEISNRNLQYPKLNHTLKLQLSLQCIDYNLSDLSQVPLFKILYLLKQTLIGAQRLIQIYGNFKMTNKMIGINADEKCKIWYNTQYQVNQPQFQCQSQSESINSILDIFKLKTIQTKNSKIFYQQIQKCLNFAQSLEFIQSWTNRFRIIVPNSFSHPNIFCQKIQSSFNQEIHKIPFNQKIALPNQNTKNFEQKILKKVDKKNKMRTTFSYKTLSTIKNNKNQVSNAQKIQQNQNFPQYLKNKFERRKTLNTRVIKDLNDIKQTKTIYDLNQFASFQDSEKLQTKISLVISSPQKNKKSDKQMDAISFLVDDRQNKEQKFDDITEFIHKMLSSTVDQISLHSQKDSNPFQSSKKVQQKY